MIKKCRQCDIDPDRPKSEQRYCLYTADGSKLLGRHPNKESALKQERAVQVHKHGMKIYADDVIEKKYPKDWGEFEPAGIEDPVLSQIYDESDKYRDDLTQSSYAESLHEFQQDILQQMHWAIDFLKEKQASDALRDLNGLLKKCDTFIEKIKGSKVSDNKLREVFIKHIQDNMKYVSEKIIPLINDNKLPKATKLLEQLKSVFFYSDIYPLVAKKIYAKKLIADDTVQTDKSTDWQEFDPQFKSLIKEKAPEKLPQEIVNLQNQQKKIVDIIGDAADYLSNEQFESTQFELQKIKGEVYHFLNEVQKLKTNKEQERKILINNMLSGLDKLSGIRTEIEELHKNKKGNLDNIWQKLLNTTSFFMSTRIKDIVAKKIYAEESEPKKAIEDCGYVLRSIERLYSKANWTEQDKQRLIVNIYKFSTLVESVVKRFEDELRQSNKLEGIQQLLLEWESIKEDLLNEVQNSTKSSGKYISLLQNLFDRWFLLTFKG